MNEGGEVREGTFEWKIDNFMQRRTLYKESLKFKFGTGYSYLDIPRSGDSRYLEVPENSDYCVRYSSSYEVFLNNDNFQKFRYNIFCKLCLIDSHNKEFIVAKRTQLQCDECFIPLITIGHKELTYEKNELLPNDVLTLRLSLNEDDSSVCEPDTGMASATNSEKKPIKLLDTLSDDFSRFYESKQNTDCVLKLGDAQFPVHRAVLSARSEVFAAMFHHDTSENRTGEVDILDVDKTALSYVLQYLYTGQIHGLSADTAAAIYTVADKYALIELRCVCLDVLKRSLTIDNVCEAALLAHIHGETDLEAKVVQFVKSRLGEIQETDQWKNLLQTKPLLAVKLLSSGLLTDKK